MNIYDSTGSRALRDIENWTGNAQGGVPDVDLNTSRIMLITYVTVQCHLFFTEAFVVNRKYKQS